MSTLETTTLTVAVHRKGQNPVYGEGVTRVSVTDEAAGPFIEVRQVVESDEDCLRLDLDELEKVVEVARELVGGFDV